MIEFRPGSIFEAEGEVEALANPVNTDGFMGKGLALEFKRRFPASYFEHYQQAAERGEIAVGKVGVWELDRPTLGSPLRFIIDFPTKKHWRGRSQLKWVEAGLRDLRRVLDTHGIASIALPALGCGNGGLEWEQVRELIEREFASVEARVVVFVPAAASSSNAGLGTARPDE